MTRLHRTSRGNLLGSCLVIMLLQTFAPDYLNSDAIPMNGNLTRWIVNHGEAQTTPLLLAVIKALKARGIKQIAATGYCFGGLDIARLVQNNTVTVGTMAHPSFLNVPTDFEATNERAVQTDAVMGDGQYEPGYFRRQFDGVAHKSRSKGERYVAAKQGAFDTSLAWIKTHLKYY
ncbi:hypothetical protein FB451DRAFT_1462224 [Mycena latifolia]|nr:hypothetical protein FB451DRAFT_1462224 [Mycena latifolia]